MQAVTPWPVTDPFLQLSGARLKGALIAGAGRVLAKRDDLNRINVFPVPDGDTGTNLAFTMLAVLKTTRRLRGADLGYKKGDPVSQGAQEVIMARDHIQVFQKLGMKLLGELIKYHRVGGYLPGPWMPSSYHCPDKSVARELLLLNRIFVRSIERKEK